MILRPLALSMLAAIGMLVGSTGHAQASTEPDAAAQQPASDASAPIDVELLQFGFAGHARPGDWTGIRLGIADSQTAPRQVAVRLHVPDPAGDTLLAERRITLNGPTQVGTWIYTRIPWSVTDSTPLTVSIHELIEVESEAPRIGRQLRAVRLEPGRARNGTRIIRPEQALIGVIGPSSMALEQYELFATTSGAHLQTSHESVAVPPGVAPARLPDQWAGLASYEAIVWGDEPVSGLPSGVGVPNALRNWILAGGHLVIVLPRVGEEWFSTRHPLEDILPAVDAVRTSGASLEPYREWITSEDFVARSLPDVESVYIFEPRAGARAGDAIPIIDGPHGVIAIRRMFGAGMVTVVGLDVTDPALQRLGLLRADRFWHRIFGKRFETPTTEQRNARNLQTRSPNFETVYPDSTIASAVRRGASAGLGVLVGLGVFAVYWLVAGPGGYMVLKWTRLTHYAWPAFVAATAVFAIIGWLGATAIRPHTTDARHFTIVDHVYGQPTQRIRSWAGVLLPNYGNATLAIDDPQRQTPVQPLLAPWSSNDSLSLTASFPDARSYVQSMTALGTLELPARATVQQVQADWVGPSRWATPVPADPDSFPESVPGTSPLIGELVHDLPAPIEEVRFIYVAGQRSFDDVRAARSPDDRGPLLADAYSWALPAGEWPPGVPQDLSTFTINAAASFERDLRNLMPAADPSGFNNAQAIASPAQIDEMYELISFFSLAPPPSTKPAASFGSLRQPGIARNATHTADISEWFTQPCLIITGQVRGPSPLPLRSSTGGADLRFRESDGITLVRWMIPLERAAVRLPDENQAAAVRAEIRRQRDQQEDED